jgi:pyruvate/2-oxoglutarate dehydrogenase complex dihydrolipoamide dehydrogenase (E3) component
MTNAPTKETPGAYDAIVIGAGQGGVPLARTLAESGRTTLLIEEKHVGGTCINEGCTPTKTMVASARVAYLARRAVDYGVRTGPISVDMRTVRRRKRDIVESFRSGSERRIRETPNLTLLPARARFVGPRMLEAITPDGAARRVGAEWVFINTGGRPTVPATPGLAEVPYLDSTTIMELETVPGHLLVLGGGYVGLEFGQMMRRFGSRVTIVQRAAVLLPQEEPEICLAMARVMTEEGIDIVLDTKATRFAAMPTGGVQVTLQAHDGERSLEVSHVLVATGRAPNSEQLNLAAANVEVDARAFVRVNERLETTAEGIFALGDVKGGPAFTHISYDDFRILRTILLEGGNASTAGRVVPYTLFTDPQLGRVGLTEREARQAGHDVAVATLPMSSVARALEMDESRGLIKAIVDRRSGRLLGAAVLGVEGGELMAVLEMAMLGEVPVQRLRDAIFAHPTLAESLNNLFAALTIG